MRWYKPEPVEPKIHSQMVIRKFLFFPKTLMNIKTKREETRWLEFANILSEYRTFYGTDGVHEYSYRAWHPLRWVD